MTRRHAQGRALFHPSMLATVFALGSFALIVIRAVTTADSHWDTLAYHWPYAARLAGLCDRDCFAFSPGLEPRYDGFPLLLTAMQGYLWRLTGTPVFADLLNIAAVVLLGVYLRYRFAVPLTWSWLAFLAIPVVHVQLTSSYIDVPLNAAVTIALMALLRMLVQREADHRADVLIALAALGFAAGSKYQMLPVALITWAAIVLHLTRRPALVRAHRPAAVFATLCLAGAVVLLPKVAVNAVEFRNPLYPIQVAIGPIQLPGTEGMMPTNSIPDTWKDSSRGLRWVASVAEFDAFRGRPLPWTVGQADVPQSNPSFRMGGYFVPYVLAALALFAWSARTSPRSRSPVVLMIVLSLICAVMPMSHELRYYLFWMMTLVSCCLAMVHSPIFANRDQAMQRGIARGIVVIAAASVIAMTGGAYLMMDDQQFLKSLLKETNSIASQIPEGGTLCVLNRDPRAFLYSSLFHPPRHYRTRSLFGDEPADCSVRLDLEH